MKKTILAALAGAVLAATPALAQFEGEATMKLTVREGSGDREGLVSKAGSRSELDIQTARMPFRMTTLMKFSNPDIMYMINDKTKTYAEMDLKSMRDQASKFGVRSRRRPGRSRSSDARP